MKPFLIECLQPTPLYAKAFSGIISVFLLPTQLSGVNFFLNIILINLINFINFIYFLILLKFHP